MTVDLRRRFANLDTPALSDALDRLDIEGQCVGIHPIDRRFRLVGQAFTVRMLPCGQTAKSVGDYIDDVAAGEVVVIDNAGRLDATVWGDILTAVAAHNGVAGTAIDGVCRDTDACINLGYPVYARSWTMRTGKDRVSAEAYNEPVQIAGIRVEPGDWLVGDADGVVIVPAPSAERVLDAAEEITAVEAQIRSALRNGGRLDIVRKEVGYHRLQSRSDHDEGGSKP